MRMNQPFWDTAWRLVRAFPAIIKQAELVEPGAGFLLPFGTSGKFEQVRLS